MSQSLALNYRDIYEPTPLPTTQNINRYWDPIREKRAAKLKPGQYVFSASNELLITVLGTSCAVCLRDKSKRFVGMTHFMLPESAIPTMDRLSQNSIRNYGRAALENLLSRFTLLGALPHNMEAALVGGAKLWNKDEGRAHRSLEFAREYLKQAGVKISGEFYESECPKKVYFNLDTTLPEVQALTSYNDTIENREKTYLMCLKVQWALNQRPASLEISPEKTTRCRSVGR